jgi:RND family efflux transporter MFP subunit
MASPAMPVASVVQMDYVKIQFDATEVDLGRLKTGQRADVTVRSYTNRTFTGKIVKISPILDPLTRMATVEVLVPNPDHHLMPGMYAEVEITTGVLDNIIVVPRDVVLESTSLINDNGKDRVVKNYFVYVVDDSSRAEQRQLNVDYVNHQNIAVRSGIVPGEHLVVSGQNNLRDGLPVQVVTSEEVQ